MPTSPRLQYKPATQSDLAALHTLWIQPPVREYLWDGLAIPKSQTEGILKANEALFRQRKFGLWLLYQEDTLLGFAGLWYFFEEAQPQLLYGLDQAFWGQGYATEAALAVMQYAFEHLQFPYLTASCDSPHQVSVAVLQRIGMELEREAEMDGKPTSFFRKENPALT